MKALILAWGYATRLFPLTENFPKPLIEINWKPIMDYVVEKVLELWINEIFVTTNNKYYSHFENRVKKYSDSLLQDSLRSSLKIHILNDQTLSNDDRLGAIWDIKYTIDQENIDDDILIVLWDNLFTFSLSDSYQLFKQKAKSVIVWYDVKNIEIAKKLWNLTLDDQDKLINFVEKPEIPASTLSSSGIYFYPKYVVKYFQDYINEWTQIQDPVVKQKWNDAPGNFLAWLTKKDDIFVKVHDTGRYDIGNFDTLKQAKEDFWEKDVDIEKLKGTTG